MTDRASTLVTVALLASAASSALADVVVDFDDGTNPFTGGALSTEQAFSGDTSLFLDMGDTAVLSIPAELQGGDVTITMMIFDQGKWIDRNVAGYPEAVFGPRWGVSGAAGSIGVSILERTFLASTDGYGTSGEGRFTGGWFSPTFFEHSANVRQDAPWLSANGGSNDGSGWQMGTAGEGAWLKATFDVAADGEVTITMEDPSRGVESTTTRNIAGPANEVWLFGGRVSDTLGLPLAGVYVDDVTIVPEPASLALLGLGGLAAFGRRRRA